MAIIAICQIVNSKPAIDYRLFCAIISAIFQNLLDQ